MIDQVKSIDGVTLLAESDCADSGCCHCLSILASSLVEVGKCYRKGNYILEMLTCIDLRSSGEGLRLVYQFLSPDYNDRHRLSYEIAEGEMAPSIASLFESAQWYESEVFDMFGVRFAGHPDLRRLLTGRTVEGFPLLKDFSMENEQVGEGED